MILIRRARLAIIIGFIVGAAGVTGFALVISQRAGQRDAKAIQSVRAACGETTAARFALFLQTDHYWRSDREASAWAAHCQIAR